MVGGRNSTTSPAEPEGYSTSPSRVPLKKRTSSDQDNRVMNDRSKRPRNISTACDQCKKRKIKCNGERPCRRCHNLELQCVYAPNSSVKSLADFGDFQALTTDVCSLKEQLKSVKGQVENVRDQELSALQRQVDYLNSKILAGNLSGASPIASRRGLAEDEASPATGLRSRMTSTASADWQNNRYMRQFHGPTSSEYDFNVAKSSLRTMGIQRDHIDEEDEHVPSKVASSQPSPASIAADQMWNLSQDDAVRYTRQYEEESSLLYPIVDVRQVITHIDLIYNDINAGRKAFQTQTLASEYQTNVVRLIVGIGLLMEGSEFSMQTAGQMFQIMEPIVSLRSLRPPSLESVTLSVLMATYLFHAGEEDSAWRWMGTAGRSCYEMGLHRAESLNRAFASLEDRKSAIRTFWIVYSLDRRWSFGTGMPFAMQDSDIDQSLPEPSDDDLYLKHITKCNRIMSKIWSLNLENEQNKSSLKHTDIEYLEFQVSQWYSDLPPILKLSNHLLGSTPDAAALVNLHMFSQAPVPSRRSLDKLRVLLALRANLATMQIYRPILHSATNINLNITYAKRAVDVARQTIALLVNLNQTTSLYLHQQVLYNYFLVQALAVVFLATSHAPADFLGATSKEFFDATSLVKHFSMKSSVSKRLWNTIRDLKTLREKIRALDQRSSLPPPTPARMHRLSVTSHPHQPSPGATIDAHLSASINYHPAGAEGWSISSTPVHAQSQSNMPPAVHPTSVSMSQPSNGEFRENVELDSEALQMSNDLLSLFENDRGIVPNITSLTPTASVLGDSDRELEKEREREAYSKIWAEIY